MTTPKPGNDVPDRVTDTVTDIVTGEDNGNASGTAEAPSMREGTLRQLGGPWGMVGSALPVIVFVPANQFGGLGIGIGAAITMAFVVLAVRLFRGDTIQPAVSGFLGVAFCAGIAAFTGEAKGYFLFGIWSALIYAVVFAVSVLLRWPLVGVLWRNLLEGEGSGWRKDRRTLHTFDALTLMWAAGFLVRFIIKNGLYDDDATGALAVAQIVMGWPMTAVLLAITFFVGRTFLARAEPGAVPDPESHDSSGVSASGR